MASRSPTLPVDRDAAIRASIRQAVSNPVTSGAGPTRSRGVRWLAVARYGAIAAAIAIVAALALRFAMTPPHADRRLVELASLAPRAATVSDPRMQAILASIVAMPAAPRRTVSGPGEFALYDIVADDVGTLPLSWLVALDVDGELVGIEGGDEPYAEPAAYDPAALHGGSVRLANVAGASRVGVGSIRLGSIVVRRDATGEAPRITERSFVGPGGETLALPVRCVRRAANGSPS